MKKFVTIMSVALVAIMSLALFAACGYSDDPDKAKEQLEKDGYTTTIQKSSETSMSNVVAIVTGTKSNIKDFTIGDLTNPEKLKSLWKETVTITYYKTEDDAKKHYDEISGNLTEKAKETTKVERQGSKVVLTVKLAGEDAK